MNDCLHPPERQYAGEYQGPDFQGQRLMWIGCLDCHRVLDGIEDKLLERQNKLHRKELTR